MTMDPMVIERAPRSRVLEWVYFRNELGLFRQWKAEEAAWRASRQVN